MGEKTRIRSIYRIPGDANATDGARRVAESELAREDAPELVENAGLLLAEIVRDRADLSTQRSPRITVDVRRAGGRQRWSVVDRGGAALPSGLRATALDKIADAWGVTRRAGLTRTWFELHRAGSRS